VQPACFISTSKKQDDSATAVGKLHDSQVKPVEDLEEKEENWISYGYSLVDRDEDEWSHHMVMFFGITVMIISTTLFFGYYPDFKDTAWSQREAYLELARREKEGLPLIDANFIDPAKINLPTDEELGDFEIIV